MTWFVSSGTESSLLERLQYPWQHAFKSALHEEKESRLGRECVCCEVTLAWWCNCTKLQQTFLMAPFTASCWGNIRLDSQLHKYISVSLRDSWHFVLKRDKKQCHVSGIYLFIYLLKLLFEFWVNWCGNGGFGVQRGPILMLYMFENVYTKQHKLVDWKWVW